VIGFYYYFFEHFYRTACGAYLYLFLVLYLNDLPPVSYGYSPVLIMKCIV
jgi:hypothetical protein